MQKICYLSATFCYKRKSPPNQPTTHLNKDKFQMKNLPPQNQCLIASKSMDHSNRKSKCFLPSCSHHHVVLCPMSCRFVPRRRKSNKRFIKLLLCWFFGGPAQESFVLDRFPFQLLHLHHQIECPSWLVWGSKWGVEFHFRNCVFIRNVDSAAAAKFANVEKMSFFFLSLKRVTHFCEDSGKWDPPKEIRVTRANE